MIISHKLKIIYVKITKVAGTSLEIALSRYCGADDIITPITKKDEKIRASLGFYGPRNYIDPVTEKPKFNNHTSAKKIKSRVPVDLWDNYLKITTIRCPYDVCISAYYFLHRGKENLQQQIPYEQFIANYTRMFKHWRGLHDSQGRKLVDFIIRYECINEDLKILEQKINCPGLLKTFQGINAKGHLRPKTRTSPCEMYSKYPKAKLMLDDSIKEYADQYELCNQYWRQYKSALEVALEKG